MIQDTVLPAARLFAQADNGIVPLAAGRHLRLALKRYLVPTNTFALSANISEHEMQHALESRRLTGPALEWYQRMRHYEHEVTVNIDANIKLYGEATRPRFLSDRHMAIYSPNDWAILPSARIACGISAWVSTHFVDDSGEKVKIHDFNQVRYTQWLDQHALDHDDSALEFWLAKQA